MQKKFLALLLRGSSMGAKFLLVVGLSKVLSTADYGIFSLIITTLTFLIFFLGLDFYNFSHREIIEDEKSKIQFLVNQFWFHLLCYILYLPIIYLIFKSDIIPFKYVIPFYFLLVLEHIGQEVFRFFNLFNKPNRANLSLLIRTALWIITMIFVEYGLFNREMNITTVLYYWIGGSTLSLLYGIGIILISNDINLKEIRVFNIDRAWIRKGIVISAPFFFGTIAYKIIEYSDRYMIDLFLGKEEVGIYSFYANFANILNIVVNTVTITLVVPDFLKVVSLGDKREIYDVIKAFTKEIYLTTGLVSLVISMIIYPILLWVNKPEFFENIMSYFVILLANIFFNISLLYHFLLYAFKKDKPILNSAIFACTVNVILNIFLIPKFGIIAAAFSTFFSFALILFLKRKYWLKFKYAKFEN